MLSDYISNFMYEFYFSDCIDVIIWYTYFKGVIMTNLEVLVASMITLDLVAGVILLVKGRELVNGIRERNRRVDATVDGMVESIDEVIAARVYEATEHLDQRGTDVALLTESLGSLSERTAQLSEQAFSLETALKALGQEVSEMKKAKTVKKGASRGKSSKKRA